MRKREREASRPYHQFVYQMSKERERIQDESTSGEGAGQSNRGVNKGKPVAVWVADPFQESGLHSTFMNSPNRNYEPREGHRKSAAFLQTPPKTVVFFYPVHKIAKPPIANLVCSRRCG
ncbi:hypothetical protein G7Y89_g14997 [Cudoniella acicularis]|uniref:Uncharacterized protein n=1 Tax=Cudoniella acicularis TaxID=354080 RepID=A0A8H4QWG2_9HELO|nr:hypothetical protein G7Y89_g14997 [Cudoniella acicularis]